jgi:hypothetical protein
MKTQEQFDKDIRSVLSSFLQSNNSISGSNFQNLIDTLINYKDNWDEEVKEYIKKIQP